jgi:paraquat-inducible protein B
MDQPSVRSSFPKASVKKSRLTWMLWLIPAGALAICSWFFYRDYVATGPLITIYFENAEGVETKNTQVMYRGVTVGQVNDVSITKDTKRVRVKARLAGFAKVLAKQGSGFWIVRPQVKMGAISGLRTIVSGEYIAVQPGTGSATNVFMGLEKQPLPEEPGALEIVLTVPALGSLQERSPIFYKGVQVGEVIYYQLDKDAHDVVLHARISAPYTPLVRADSKFWNAGGIYMHFGLFSGVQMSAESPKTLISGGIEFATPPEAAPQATNDTVFELNEKPEEKWKNWVPTIPLQLPQAASATNTPAPAFLQ